MTVASHALADGQVREHPLRVGRGLCIRIGRPDWRPVRPGRQDVVVSSLALPQGLVLVIFAAIGLALWIAAWRRERPPQAARSVVGFAALTYALLVLYYPAWNPQYVFFYLLPFLVLLWPGPPGASDALALMASCLADISS